MTKRICVSFALQRPVLTFNFFSNLNALSSIICRSIFHNLLVHRHSTSSPYHSSDFVGAFFLIICMEINPLCSFHVQSKHFPFKKKKQKTFSSSTENRYCSNFASSLSPFLFYLFCFPPSPERISQTPLRIYCLYCF